VAGSGPDKKNMNNEKLKSWALIAEIVGGLAVLLSIVYLAVEVRANTSAIQSQTNQGLLELLNEYTYKAEENAELMMKGSGNWEDLDDIERYRYRQLWFALANIWEQAFNSNRSGTLSNDLWEGWDGDAMRETVCTESGREVWNSWVDTFSPGFQLHVDEVFLDCARLGY